METYETGANGHDGPRSIGKAVDRIGQSAQQVWSSTRDAYSDLKDALDLQGRVERHPYGMLLAALGVGYVLGGGLFSRLTGRILGTGLRIGLRLAAVPFIRNELGALVEEQVSSDEAARGETAPRTRRARQSNQNENKGK